MTTDPIFVQLEQQVTATFGELETRFPIAQDKYFETLVESIVSQQLSVKVADVIYARLLAHLGTITPESVLAASDDELRQLGLSTAKVKYVKSLATAWTDGSLQYEVWESADNEEIVAELITVKGIGVWTAEMFLISALARPDVFSVGDLGLRAAVARHYGVDVNDRKKITEIAASWAPNRTHASRVLWKSLEL